MQTLKAKLDQAEAAQQANRPDAAISFADEALAHAREGNDALLVAFALRHTAKLRSKLCHFDQSALEIAEAIRIYRDHSDDHILDLANALRIEALNAERRAHAAWHEAEMLYASVHVEVGVTGAQHHLQHLTAALGGPS